MIEQMTQLSSSMVFIVGLVVAFFVGLLGTLLADKKSRNKKTNDLQVGIMSVVGGVILGIFHGLALGVHAYFAMFIILISGLLIGFGFVELAMATLTKTKSTVENLM